MIFMFWGEKKLPLEKQIATKWKFSNLPVKKFPTNLLQNATEIFIEK